MRVVLTFDVWPESEEEGESLLEDIEDWPRMLHGDLVNMEVVDE